MKKLLYTLLFINYSVFAFNPATTIQKNLLKELPQLEVTKIESTPISNIYQVVSKNKVFYTDLKGEYLIIGNIIELKSKTNITQEKIDILSKVDFKDLPLKQAIIHINGDGRYKLAVFTDPHCPFCQKLEQVTLKNLQNTTIYYFLLPSASHEGAIDDAKKILCSENKEKVFLDYMQNGVSITNNNTNCPNAKKLDEINLIAKKFNIEATPSIITEDSKLIVGVVSADYLNQELNK